MKQSAIAAIEELVRSVAHSAATGKTIWNTAPRGVFPATHNRPP